MKKYVSRDMLELQSIYYCAGSILLSIGSIVFNELDPLRYLGAKSIMEPRLFVEKEMVDFWIVVLCAVFVVPLCILVIQMNTRKDRDIIRSITIAYFGMSISNFIVNSLKYLVGKERPDYLSRIKKYNVGRRYLEARRSFPSGHSAVAVSCAIFIAYEASSAMKRSKNHPVKRVILMVFGVVLPIILAVFVAVSRIIDGRHDIIDVTGGCGISLVSCGLVIKYCRREKMHSKDKI
ncbi:diacylglycerol diphosphate phosphatase / phosphatidate phosphatase [Nematocida sp. LUAm3]|nr:diacylglycerol diphosphate phosphatase / phosphatidate phosphatase [Nematocida sp. LUAm3]KAI5175654.1 diacylglycerol diphosphate phosphatase / phosphatidate phosphatase [Nematocida sp. LUAm2]KAI5178560.1 diacylglycerol diphosphate phosphatase / phosphatidate phosphatase [Nematocida sp. LUAm1]